MALEHGLRGRVGLLMLHAPVFQLLERDRHRRHSTAHECPRAHDTEVAIEVSDLRLAGHLGGSAEAVQHVQSPFRAGTALSAPKSLQSSKVQVAAKQQHSRSDRGIKPFRSAAYPCGT